MEADDLTALGLGEPVEGRASAAGEAAASPPALRLLPWLRTAAFTREDAGRFVRLRVEGELRPRACAPNQVQLVVRRGAHGIAYRPLTICSERAPTPGRRGQLGTRVALSFAVPPALVESRSVDFKLVARGRGEVELPFPALAPLAEPAPRLSVGAVVSTAALGVTTMLGVPTAALAAGVGGPAPRTSGPAACATDPTGTSTDPTGTSTSTTTTPTTTTPTTTTPTTSTTSTTTTSTTTTPDSSSCTPTTTTTTPTPPTTTPTPPTTTTPPSAGGSSLAATLSQAAAGAAAKGTVTGHVAPTAGLRSANGNAPAPKPHRETQSSSTSTLLAGDFGPGDLWGGGTALADPFTVVQLEHFAAEASSVTKPPRFLVRIYRQAARRYHLPWEVLAAINYIETGYGSDLAVSPAGAVGWMQFMPATWAQYGEAVAAGGRLLRDQAGSPWLPRDAIYSAARLLVADGARHSLAKAVYGYNHAQWYVQEVLTLAQRITSKELGHHPKPRLRIAAMVTMARLLQGIGYVWGGGHADTSWIVQAGYDCSGFVSAVLHAGGYLRLPQTTQTLPGQQGIERGPGRWVTIFDRTDAGIGDDHVIVDLDGQFWEEGGGGPAGGPAVHLIRHLSGGYLRSFNVELHPKGL